MFDLITIANCKITKNTLKDRPYFFNIKNPRQTDHKFPTTPLTKLRTHDPILRCGHSTRHEWGVNLKALEGCCLLSILASKCMVDMIKRNIIFHTVKYSNLNHYFGAVVGSSSYFIFLFWGKLKTIVFSFIGLSF